MSDDYELWKSNNSNIMALVENIVKVTKAGVYCILKANEEEKRWIDLN